MEPTGECIIDEPQIGISNNVIPLLSNQTENKLKIYCEHCNDWFLSHQRLLLHLIFNHSIQYCTICTQTFTSHNEKKYHFTTVHGAMACTTCGEKVVSELKLIKHLRKEHQSYTCVLCGEVCHMKSSLKSHFKKLHHVSVKVTSSFKKYAFITMKGTSFHCSLCDTNQSQSIILDHLLSYHQMAIAKFAHFMQEAKLDFLVPGGKMSSSLNVVSVEVSKNNAHCCGVCHNECPSDLPELETIHRILCMRMSYCKYCEITIPNTEKMADHCKEKHVQYECNLCDVIVLSESLLLDHILKYHNKLTCICCGLQYEQEELNSHLTTFHICTKHTPNENSVPFSRSDQTDKALLECVLCGLDLRDDFSVDKVFSHFIQHHHCSAEALAEWFHLKPVQVIWNHACTIKSKLDEQTNLLSTKNILDDDINSMLEIGLAGEKSMSEFPEPFDFEAIDLSDCGSKNMNFSDWSDTDTDNIGNTNNTSTQSNTDTSMYDDWELEINPNTVECTGDSDVENDVTDVVYVCEICTEESQTWLDLQNHCINQHNFFTRASSFECSHCHKTFTQETTLNEHLYLNHGEGSQSLLSCPFCQCSLPTKCQLRDHITSKHDEIHLCPELSYKCRKCNLLFWELSEWDHHMISTHTDCMKEFMRCLNCLAMFASKRSLEKHVCCTESHGFRLSPFAYKCRLCLVVVPTLQDLHNHTEIEHLYTMLYRCCQCGEVLKSKNLCKHHMQVYHQKKNLEYYCRECGRGFHSIRACHVHSRMKHDRKGAFQCRLCPQRFESKEERKGHYKLSHAGEDHYKCDNCGKGFTSKSGLYAHKQNHNRDIKWTCSFCGKEFTRRDSYNEHLLIHIGPRHKCPHCPKDFVQKSNLIRHVRIHTGERPYKCTFCDKTFSDKGSCNSHIRIHTKEDVCNCTYCGQRFSKKQKLKYHLRKHTGEGLVICDICGKAFTNSFAMKDHRVIHDRESRVNCEQCGRTFQSEKYMRRHVVVIHNQQMKLHCHICSKTFLSLEGLKSHLLRHAGIKQLQCALCGKGYSDRKGLKRHLTTIHQIQPNDPNFNTNITTLFYDHCSVLPDTMISSVLESVPSHAPVELCQYKEEKVPPMCDALIQSNSVQLSRRKANSPKKITKITNPPIEPLQEPEEILS